MGREEEEKRRRREENLKIAKAPEHKQLVVSRS